jgi:hypothetical protein
MSDKFANDEDKAAIEKAEEFYSCDLQEDNDADRLIYHLWRALNRHFLELDYGNSDWTEDDMLDEILDVVDRRFRKRAKLDERVVRRTSETIES